MLSKKTVFVLLATLSLLLSIGYYFFLLRDHLAAKPLTILGQVTDFRLTDSLERQFSLEELKGKIWVADFIFTTCGGICPVMTQNMSQIYKSFRDDETVHFVSVSVNPEYDTPAVLAQYSQKYSADPSRWHFLTGPRDLIEHLAVNGFKVGSAEEPIFHSAYFILVDRQARIRQYYEGTQKETIGKIKSDIELLLKEVTK